MESIYNYFRRGNLIQYHSTGDVSILNFDGENADFKPILISDKLLIALGFINLDKSLEWKLNNFIFERKGIYSNRFNHEPFKFIHELQNAYFENFGTDFQIDIEQFLSAIYND